MTRPMYWPRLLALSAEEWGVLEAALCPLCARTRTTGSLAPQLGALPWVLLLELLIRTAQSLGYWSLRSRIPGLGDFVSLQLGKLALQRSTE